MVVARLGLLEYLQNIKSIEIEMKGTVSKRDYDVDEINVRTVETDISRNEGVAFKEIEFDRGIRLRMWRQKD